MSNTVWLYFSATVFSPPPLTTTFFSCLRNLVGFVGIPLSLYGRIAVFDPFPHSVKNIFFISIQKV